MSLLNAIPVLVVSIGYLARRGAHPSVVLIAPVGTLVGGAVLAWGLRSRRQWAWFATLLAFGSLFGGSLVLAAGSLYHGVGATVFLAMGVGSASALPLTILWRDRGLYGSAGSDEEEEMISS